MEIVLVSALFFSLFLLLTISVHFKKQNGAKSTRVVSVEYRFISYKCS